MLRPEISVRTILYSPALKPLNKTAKLELVTGFGKTLLSELLKVFFTSQDPTTPDQQGPDRGNSYRSIIFYKTPEEKAFAEQAKKDFAKSFKNPIVSEIKPLTEFYKAEGYHQNYIEHNPHSSYVQGVSIPRFELFKRTYKGKLKH